MKKVYLIFMLISLFLLSACSHEHSWNDASCTTPKTCSECGEVEGIALGHSWKEATCVDSKKCTRCNEIEGKPLEHTWVNATCTLPKTCTKCNSTEGAPIEHVWQEATCVEAKECKLCGKTEGEALGHDAPELTCVNDSMCNRCNTMISAPGHTLNNATCTEAPKCTICGEIAGEPLGHTSTTGVCSRCKLEVYNTVSGKGDDVIQNINVGEGIYRVHFVHSGRSNFIIKSYDDNNDRELLVNEIGKYDGYVLLSGDSPYIFEISADGAWTYTIEKLQQISDTSFSGKGDYVTGYAILTSGAWEFVHDGKSNFAVKIWTKDGRDLLVNEIGKYNAKRMVTIPKGSYAFFEVTADGNWSIKKAQ